MFVIRNYIYGQLLAKSSTHAGRVPHLCLRQAFDTVSLKHVDSIINYDVLTEIYGTGTAPTAIIASIARDTLTKVNA